MHASAHDARPGGPAGPVLVAGATGRTGRLIVDKLAERAVPVLALVRDRAKASTLPDGVQSIVGDVCRPATLTGVMDGVSALIIATTGSGHAENSAELVDYFGTQNVLREAAAADVGLVVYVSSIYATRPEHYQDVGVESLGWKARGEEVVRKAGVPYCIVRAGWLTDDAGGDPLVLSQGDVAEGHLSRADLAEVCVRVLDLEQARGKTFEVVTTRSADAADLEAALTVLPADAAPAA